MYTLAVRRDFITRYFLIGAERGAEGFPNSHHYQLELQLRGSELNEHGYLVDLNHISRLLGELVAYYGEKLLNDLPEFKGLNPTLENFSRILATTLDRRIEADNVLSVKMTVWEDEDTWASYQVERALDTEV